MEDKIDDEKRRDLKEDMKSIVFVGKGEEYRETGRERKSDAKRSVRCISVCMW